MRFGLIGLLILCFAVSASAQTQETSYAQTENVREIIIDKENFFALGAAIGSPSAIAAIGGYYFGPLAVRVSGGYWSKNWYGVQGDLSVNLSRIGTFSQNLSLVAGRFGIRSYDSNDSRLLKTQNYVGVAYDVNYTGFFMQLGAGFGNGDYKNPQLLTQFGYLFEL